MIASTAFVLATTTVATGQAAAQPIGLDLVGSFSLPGGAFDVLPDGRLLAVTSDGEVLLQSAPNSSSYTAIDTIPQPNSDGFGASFVSVNPSGNRIAVGNNEFNSSNAVSVYDLDISSAGVDIGSQQIAITTPNFSGDWADDDTLFVTGAESSTFATVVNRLGVTGGTVDTVVTPAGLFSGGVAFDSGTLYAGAGDTGEVRSFDAAFPSAPVSFTDGNNIATANSAASIDVLGNLLLIAGQQSGQQGDATVVDLTSGATLTLQPAGPGIFYGGYFNAATNQLVVTATNFTLGTSEAFVYNIPAPAVLTLLPIAGIAASRRRR
ncbi:MAG: hypothetical protein AAGB48_09845 [Planctomycetota bacterium]